MRTPLRALAVVLAAVSAGIAATPATTARALGPFVALASGHVGARYSDTLASAFEEPVSNYQLAAGTLPRGLALDAGTGTIAGTPLDAGSTPLRFSGTTASGEKRFVRAALPIFTRAESEIRRGQSFEQQGPATVKQVTGSFAWTSSFDGSARQSDAVVFVPDSAGPHPLLVFHYGRGFTYTDYPGFLSRIASWGIVVAACSDTDSFGGGNYEYDIQRAELGMESASAAQEALMDYVLGRSASSGDALSGTVDPEAVFLSGHSRGGGATHGSHVRAASLRIRGVVYFMPFDLRYFTACNPPGQSPAYAIPTAQDRLPSLIISAGDDGDLAYPYCDQLIERATGPTTFVTVNGACHDFLSDNHASERTVFGGPIPAGDIDRATEQALIAHWVVAFVKRWAADDLSLEGLLYGDEWAASPRVTVASWRRSSPSVLVDDFQDADPATNLLRGANAASGLSRVEESVYPALGDYASLGIRNDVLMFTDTTASYATDLGGADLSGCATFLARIEAPVGVAGPFSYARATGPGYQLGTWVKLVDAAGVEASVKVTNEDGTTLGFLPGRATPGDAMPPSDRFSTLAVPLAKLVAASPKLDLAHVARLELVFARGASSPSIVVLDDLRFEGGANAPATTPSTLTPTPTPTPTLTTVLAASGAANVAPEALASAYGQGLPTSGVTLTITDALGVARAAAISYSSATQVNFVVPAGTALGAAKVTASGGGTSVSGIVNVASVAPGVFTADSSGKGVAAASFVRVHADGSQSFENAASYDAATKTWRAVPVDVSTGEPVYLVLYATGLRGHSGLVAVTIGGVAATVSYAGPQMQYAGLDQVNVLVPASLMGRGVVTVSVKIDGVDANAVTIAVQ